MGFCIEGYNSCNWGCQLGLRNSLHNFELVPIVDVCNLGELVPVLGCGTGTLPLSHFRSPLRVFHQSTAVWDVVGEMRD
jgi:hypothetical protein